MKKQKTVQEQIKHSEEYVIFLEKQLNSKNYKNNVSELEYNKQKDKLAKERLILKLLKSKK